MSYLVDKPKRRTFREDRISKHVKILRELPSDMETRTANAHKRNDILKANKRYQLEIERQRGESALQRLPRNQQANLNKYMALIQNDLLQLSRKGGVP